MCLVTNNQYRCHLDAQAYKKLHDTHSPVIVDESCVQRVVVEQARNQAAHQVHRIHRPPLVAPPAELHRSVLATLRSSHHHKLVFSDCKHTDSSYMSLCRSSSRPDFKLSMSQAMSFPYLIVLLILQTKKLESFYNYDSKSIFLSLIACDFILSLCSSAWFLCGGISYEKRKTHFKS